MPGRRDVVGPATTNEVPVESAFDIATAKQNRQAAVTVAAWAKRTRHDGEEMLEVIDILGLGSDDSGPVRTP
jgi:hypothetical protein